MPQISDELHSKLLTFLVGLIEDSQGAIEAGYYPDSWIFNWESWKLYEDKAKEMYDELSGESPTNDD